MATDPLRLTDAEQIALRDADGDIKAVADAIRKLHDSGFDVTDLQERLQLAQQRRAGLLQHFGNPIVTP